MRKDAAPQRTTNIVDEWAPKCQGGKGGEFPRGGGLGGVGTIGQVVEEKAIAEGWMAWWVR